MRKFLVLFTFVSFSWVPFLLFGSNPQEKNSCELVLEVTEVNVRVLKTYPPKLQIVAHGIVPTSGYENPLLIEESYEMPPSDGIYDFYFLAKKPEGIALQILTPLTAMVTTDLTPNMNGVRIHASSNTITKLFRND